MPPSWAAPMTFRALAEGAKRYTVFLLKTVLFPLVWLWALRLARRHEDVDPRGRSKVLAGIVVGVVLAVAGFLVLLDFQADATDEMYDQLETRLAVATGESEYQDQLTQVAARDVQISILEQRLAEAEAAGNEADARAFRENLTAVQVEKDAAMAKADALERNHQFFMDLVPLVEGQDDAQVKQRVASFADDTPPAMYDLELPTGVAPIRFDADSMESQSRKWFNVKDSAQEDMQTWMLWLFLPGLVGVFFAPLVMAVSSILKNAWEPSETVGYKEYPGNAMGWFLLLGGFGVPALFFASWSFWDMDVRSVEGQIAL